MLPSLPQVCALDRDVALRRACCELPARRGDARAGCHRASASLTYRDTAISYARLSNSARARAEFEKRAYEIAVSR